MRSINSAQRSRSDGRYGAHIGVGAVRRTRRSSGPDMRLAIRSQAMMPARAIDVGAGRKLAR